MNEIRERLATDVDHFVLFKGVVGSQAYGMQTEASDTDLKGVCLGPVDQYLGLEQFEQWENPDQDEVIYELRKFARLGLAANPSVIELLWLPEYVVIHPLGQRLIDIRECFLSQQAHKTFSGYAVGQIKKCRAKAADPDIKAGIKAKNPYKHAAHCLRLLRMGHEVITTGQLNVDRTGLDADELKAIRQKERPLEDVLAEAESMLPQIDAAVNKSPLPKQPNRDQVQKVIKSIIWDYLMSEYALAPTTKHTRKD